MCWVYRDAHAHHRPFLPSPRQILHAPPSYHQPLLTAVTGVVKDDSISPNLSLRRTNPFSTTSNPPAIDSIFGRGSSTGGMGVTSEAAFQILLTEKHCWPSTTSNNNNRRRYPTPPRTQSKLRIKLLTTVKVRIQWYAERG